MCHIRSLRLRPVNLAAAHMQVYFAEGARPEVVADLECVVQIWNAH